FLRITSADLVGNASIANAPSLTVPGPTLRDTAAVDFLAGTRGTCDQDGLNCVNPAYVSQTDDGEVTLAPVVGQEFFGTTVPLGWIVSDWSSGGSVVVGGGYAMVDGSLLGTCDVTPGDCTSGAYAPSHSLEFVATFTGDGFQHAGLGTTLADYPW